MLGGGLLIAAERGGSVTHTVTYYPIAGVMRINSTGATVGEDRFYPFGETRLSTGTMFTDRLYTGQRQIAELGIYHYNARFYSPTLGRFLSADTLMSGFANPQNLNRYSYVKNNPINASDPTGHYCVGDLEGCVDETGEPVNGAPLYLHQDDDDGDSPINDPDWGEKPPEERAPLVWDAICQSGGWWGEGCPSEQQLASWLLFKEGGTLDYGDQENMAGGIRYRFAYFGNTPETFVFQLSGFTAFYNPNRGGGFDQNDWDQLTNPQFDFEGAKDIIDKVYESPIKVTDGNYLYWWSKEEVVTSQSQWPGKVGEDYTQTKDVTGQPFYFTGIPNIRDCAMEGQNCK